MIWPDPEGISAALVLPKIFVAVATFDAYVIRKMEHSCNKQK